MKTCRYCLNPAQLIKHGEEQPCRREVAGFPGYQVSCDGKVYSCWNSRCSLHVTKPVATRSVMKSQNAGRLIWKNE